MKVLFELTLETSEYCNSKFEWLSDASNRLFLIEGGKRLRTISIGTEPGRVLESANLADGRTCTSFSWNKDGNQLAMVVDKHLIYFWDVRDNNLLHYKPLIKASSDANSATKSRAKDVEQIIWSKTTNKVVIGYSTGQLLLCSKETSLSETLIDNSSGVLGEIYSIESSPHSDVFACISVLFELLVMTFDGDAIFYNQGSDNTISMIKFSHPFSPNSKSSRRINQASNKQTGLSFWLAHKSQENEICLRLIELKDRHTAAVQPANNLVYRPDDSERVIYYEWLDTTNLIVCLESGTVSLVQIKSPFDRSTEFSLSSMNILGIHSKELSVTDADGLTVEAQDRKLFRSFNLICHSDNIQGVKTDQASGRGKTFSFSAMTMYTLHYYELLEMSNDASQYTFEKIDELDLTGSLSKIGLSLEQQQWSSDSSMLAVQLTNGHILIYQTRLNDHMIMSYGSRTAYLSESNEVTVLNYGLVGESDEAEPSGNLCRSPVDKSSSGSLDLTSRASIIKIDLKPSVIAIGPTHLAAGLNNVVRFYSTRDGQLEFQEEYHSIVSSICLGSKFVSVQFKDGRVKLHPLKVTGLTGDDHFLNERYFPDPTKSERISAFTLTNHLFLYCTTSFNLYVFCLRSWNHIQNFNYQSDANDQVIKRLVSNGMGNKFLCLTKTLPTNQCRVFLYDSYRNEMISFRNQNGLYAKIFQSQLALVPTLCQSSIKSIPFRDRSKRAPTDLSRISSVIWDTDGRSALLVERRYIHVFVISDHTLETEGPMIEWVTTIGKQSTYETLYASHGVISFQSSLGRVINSVAESHDDEANLGKLGQNIQAVISRMTSCSKDKTRDVQAEIMRLKLEYLQMIVLIYPLSKCAEICEYIMMDNLFNVADELRLPEIDDVLWRQLAARALFISNLHFAMLVYKRRRSQVFARGLTEIIDDCSKFGFDSKTSVTTRLLILLGCDIDDD